MAVVIKGTAKDVIRCEYVNIYVNIQNLLNI